MRLLKVKLTNFRRFADETLDVSERLLALVGPNEAGKSSVLDAIEMLGRRRSPSPKDVTRLAQGPAKVAGLYVLDDADRSALAGIRDGPIVTHCWVTMDSSQERSTWAVTPRPMRDLAPRRRCWKLVNVVRTNLAEGFLDEEVLDALGTDRESLTEGEIKALEATATRLRSVELPDSDEETNNWSTRQVQVLDERLTAASSALVDLAQSERQPLPVKQVMDVLATRLPSTAFFRLSDRELDSEYDLAEVADDPSPALHNLCALAELDLSDVKIYLDRGNRPHVEKLIESANQTLKNQFQGAWTQSMVYPRLAPPHDGTLRIFVATEDEGYSHIEERSDGLRWFLALRSFLGARGTTQPILLVDEAETHLHYDAQADLVDALMSQKLVSKVIYSTHSVGCLPPDLGCGIRAVVPDRRAERSRIANSYWSISPDGEERVGHAPLLFAMGATMLAWTVPRRAVIVEGPSDAILLPTLFREASKLHTLPYRIVPGLSEVREDRMSSLAHHAMRTVFLTDGDEGGLHLGERLKNNGVDGGRLFDLGAVRRGAALEDLVAATVFAEALNEEIETWALGPPIRADRVPGLNRWTTLCGKGTTLENLNKSRVAQRVVDLARPDDPLRPVRSILAPRLGNRLATLHDRLVQQLDVPEAP